MEAFRWAPLKTDDGPRIFRGLSAECCPGFQALSAPENGDVVGPFGYWFACGIHQLDQVQHQQERAHRRGP